MSFQMKVSTELPVEQYRYLYEVSRRTHTTIGALVAELVRRQLAEPTPASTPQRRRFTAAEDEVVATMAAEGCTNGEIARHLGRPRSTINNRRRARELPPAPTGRPKKVSA